MVKRFLLPCLLIFGLLSGCASLDAERNVVANTFYSSYPKCRIRINPDYKYVGQFNNRIKDKASDLTTDSQYDFETYIFLMDDNRRPKKAKKAIIIQIEEVATQYAGDFFGNVKNKLESGVCELEGRKYHYYTKAIAPSWKSNTIRFLSNEGFIMPQCVLSKTAGRVVGAKGNILFKFNYFMDVTELDYTCRDWKDRDTLTKEQRSYLEKFERHWENSFEVLPQ